MIVKDEAEVIERCLASVRDVIDHWIISDTGSLDGTQNLVRRALRGIPGELMERKWENFSVNRNEVLAEAEGKADYLLLLDADEVLEIVEEPDELTADGYWIVRDAGDFAYAVPLLVNNAVEWYYRGAVHEILVPQDEHPWVDLPGLRVIHHADGAREDTRLEHNLELLEQQIAAQPDDPRTVFYMAQTYREMGEFEEAIEFYRRRLTLGGWDEELYYSQWQLGCMLRTMDWREGLLELLSAWNRRPTRLEALYDAVVLCRDQQLWQLGYTLSAAGLDREPPNDKLFLHLAVWEWGIRFEYAIAAYWVGDHENAIRVNDELLAMSGIPEHVTEQAAKNRQFSLDVLASAGADS